MRYHLTLWEWPSSKILQTINAGKGVEKIECSCTVGGNVNWYSHYGRWYGDPLKKLGIKPPYDPEITLLGINPEETKMQKDTCIPLFIAALFTIARTWKAMAPHSSTLAWKIPWMEQPSRLQSMGSLRIGHDWATSLSLFTFMHWRRKWQPSPMFLPGESQGWGSLVGCRLWGLTESDTTEVT